MKNTSCAEGDWVSIAEFRSLTCLSHEEILSLIERRELTLAEDSQLGWCVLLDGIDLNDLAKAKLKSAVETDGDIALWEETIASEIVNFLDSILDEALSLALCWYEKDRLPETPASVIEDVSKAS